MAGLDPATHAAPHHRPMCSGTVPYITGATIVWRTAWVAGSSPAMTMFLSVFQSLSPAAASIAEASRGIRRLRFGISKICSRSRYR